MQSEIEVLRVIRVPPMGSLVVHADNRRYTQIAGVKDDKLRQRLLVAIGELVSFAGGYDALVSAGVAPALPTAASGDSSAERQDQEQLTRQQAAFLAQLERELRANAAPETLQGNAHIDDARRQLQADEIIETRGPTGGVNLVAEIDLILQKHLVANERLARRRIHLRQAPGELLQIVVDGKIYEHPNEIEDEDVKRALKGALKEWEAR